MAKGEPQCVLSAGTLSMPGPNAHRPPRHLMKQKHTLVKGSSISIGKWEKQQEHACTMVPVSLPNQLTQLVRLGLSAELTEEP